MIIKEKIRADMFLVEYLQISRSQAQKIVKQRNLPKILYAGYDIDLENICSTVSNSIIESENIPLDIIYEDNEIIVINKPCGMVVHPAAGHMSHTLVNALLHHCQALNNITRAGLIHRLDKDTSGLILVAKTVAAHVFISRQFQDRSVVKRYDAIVYGKIVPYTKIETYLERSNKRITVSKVGKYALTEFFIKKTNNLLSHVQCLIHTGRTHQIRVHAQHICHPIVGDVLYSNRHYVNYHRLCLHASYIEFTHPNGSRVNFTSNATFIDDLIK